MQPPPGGYPPPNYSAAPPKKTNRNLILIIILICIGVPCIGVIVAGIFAFRIWNTMTPTMGCLTSITLIGKGVTQYAREHKGLLPKADTWQDDVRPYYQRYAERGKAPFDMMPPNGDWTCAPSTKGGKSTGVAFNTDLSGKKLADIENPDIVALVFEVPEIGRNLHRPYKRLSEESSPSFMGSHRGWIWIDAAGSMHGMKNSSGVRISGDDFDRDKPEKSSTGSSDSSESPESSSQ